MDIKSIIRSEKSNVQTSEWKNGPISASTFPLSGRSRRKLYSGTEWEWRTITFSALEKDFVVLVRLNEMKEYFSSILAMHDDEKLKVICHHELHTSHKDWHCHFVRSNVDKIHPGVLRDSERMRCYPSYIENDECTLKIFPVNKSNALEHALRTFKIDSCGGLI